MDRFNFCWLKFILNLGILNIEKAWKYISLTIVKNKNVYQVTLWNRKIIQIKFIKRSLHDFVGNLSSTTFFVTTCNITELYYFISGRVATICDLENNLVSMQKINMVAAAWILKITRFQRLSHLGADPSISSVLIFMH